MIKLAIFDMDGVLANTTHIHTSALRDAVYTRVHEEASREHYLTASDGIRTTNKLECLRAQYGLSDEIVKSIDELKESLTLNAFGSIQKNELLISEFSRIKNKGIRIAIGSNSRRVYVDKIIQSLGLSEFIDFSIAGNEVFRSKPDPEIFNTIMARFNISNEDTIIFEDSIAGLKAAHEAKANVEFVNNRTLITLEQLRKI